MQNRPDSCPLRLAAPSPPGCAATRPEMEIDQVHNSHFDPVHSPIEPGFLPAAAQTNPPSFLAVLPHSRMGHLLDVGLGYQVTWVDPPSVYPLSSVRTYLLALPRYIRTDGIVTDTNTGRFLRHRVRPPTSNTPFLRPFFHSDDLR